MKKTRNALIGVTALIVAFSACALTACNKQPEDGSISGNYQEATTEQINDALKDVDYDQLFGDTEATDYKFGIEESANFSFSMTMGEYYSLTATLSADYQTLATNNGTNVTMKGAGNAAFNGELKTPLVSSDGAETTIKTDSIISNLTIYQEDFKVYASASYGTNAEELTTEKAMVDLYTLMAVMPVSGLSSYATISGIDGTTTNTPASMDLVTVINMLNELGATTTMDAKDGVKLKISFNEDAILSLVSQSSNMPVETLKEYISFTTCKLDIYLSIDKENQFDAASVVVDIDATLGQNGASESSATAEAEETASTTNIKLSGNATTKVNSNVNPTAFEDFKAEDYEDCTVQLIRLIANMM